MTKPPIVPKTSDFLAELERQLAAASASGGRLLDISAKQLHIDVGGYPSRNHAMASCSSVMWAAKRPEDEVLHQPPKGKGASLKIRYLLPR